MERSLPIYASTASRRDRGRGWSSRRRRRWARLIGPTLLAVTVSGLALLALGVERALG